MTIEKFKEIRKSLGKSQRALSQVLGVSHGTISNYEMGYKEIEPEIAEQMRTLSKHQRDEIATAEEAWG